MEDQLLVLYYVIAWTRCTVIGVPACTGRGPRGKLKQKKHDHMSVRVRQISGASHDFYIV
jgi:hypothetical protein